MKTLGKFLGLLLLAVLLIAVALGFALTHLLDPNNYKDDLRQLARDKGGVDLTLEGPIGWSLFPWIGLQLNEVSVSSPLHTATPFARIGQLGLAVKVMPLLSGQVEMSAIQLDGLQLDLRRDAAGKGNWELAASTASTGSSAPPAAAGGEPAPASQGSAPALQLDIESLQVRNARLQFSDEARGSFHSLSELNLTTGAIREGSPIALELFANFASNPPKINGNTRMTAVLRIDPQIRRYQLQDLQLDGQLGGEPLAGKTLDYSVQGQLLADLAAGNAEWRSLKLRANQLDLLGELRVRQLDQATPVVEAQLSAAAFDLRAFLGGLGIELPPTSDPKALSQLAFSTRITSSGQNLSLDDLSLQLDDTRFSGSVTSSNLGAGQLSVQLQGDRLDADRYLPPQPAATAGAGTQTGAAAGSARAPASQAAWSDEPLLPLTSLRTLEQSLALDLQHLTLRRLPLENLRLRSRASGGNIELQQLFANLFGGRIDLKATLDARSDTPKLGLQLSQSGLPVEQLLAALSPDKPAQLRGKLQLDASLQARGNSQRALIGSLGGNAAFKLGEGALVGLALEQKLCQGIALVNRQALSQGFPADTAIQSMRGSLQISQGIASNSDLNLKASGLDVAGKGSINLPQMSLDYRAGVTLTDAYRTSDPACRVNERLASVAWPLRCNGALASIGSACGIDKEAMTAIVAKAAGGKLQEKLQEKLGDKAAPLGDALKGLFGR